MNIYCQACGQPNNYGSVKPKFCNNCGVSLGGKQKKAAKKAAKKNSPEKAQVATATLEDDDVITVPDLSRLEVEIEAPKLKGVRLGEIAGTGPAGEDDGFTPPEGEKVSQEEFLRQFQREAGSLREKGDN